MSDSQTITQSLPRNAEMVRGILHRRDAKGRLVPESTISPMALLEDQTVEMIIGHAVAISEQVARFKAHCFDDISALLDTLFEQYQVKKGTGRGNVTLSTIDGCLKVQLAIQDFLDFGPELRVAAELMQQCLSEWASGAPPELRAAVESAFATNKLGKINTEALLGLRRIKSENPNWNKAMDVLNDSIRVIASKEYMRFYRRDKVEDGWEAITVNIASAKPPTPSDLE
ncbi:MAG: DUF3164 family protein [Candidatus Pacebacteria bacterium]|nr:DUF3164 family protein [Candidatus Paceibacterota bacterium]